MMGIGACLVVRVTGNAREYRVVAGVRMAVGTGCPGVGVRAGIDGELAVCKRRAGPGGCRVAVGAGGRETGRGVVGIIRGLILRFVAGITIRGSTSENVIDVASGTGHVDMSACQREGRVVVVERSGAPGCGGVTDFASLRVSAGNVIRISRLLEIVQVAGDAGGA